MTNGYANLMENDETVTSNISIEFSFPYFVQLSSTLLEGGIIIYIELLGVPLRIKTAVSCPKFIFCGFICNSTIVLAFILWVH